MTERALDACAELQKRGIHAGVLHVPTLKPLDTEAIAKFAASVSRVLVAENHVSSGGLASQVAEVLYDSDTRTRLTRIGLPDKFIECGSVPVLQQRYGLTVDRIIDVALASGSP
jgi:transketolase